MDTMHSQITPRRGFIGRLAAVGAALGAGALFPDRLQAAAPALALPDGGDGDLESWPGTVRAKHKQVYDAVSPNDGFAMKWSYVFLWTNNEASRIEDRDLAALVVLRHSAAPLALADAAWEKYRIGEMLGITDPATSAPAARNIFRKPEPDEIFPASIEVLQKRGVRLGVCNLALRFYSGARAQQLGLSPEQAYADWKAAVLPGIQVLPSGVWGVNRAQEKGFTYCYAG